MKRFKRIVLILFALMFIGVAKIDVNAEKIWNTTGEKDPLGNGYNYKYWSGSSWTYCGDGSSKYYPTLIDISYDVTYNYEEAYKMLEYVNQARREAGVQELVMKDDLMDVAMYRAAESRVYWEHMRPDGSCIQSYSPYIYGENLTSGGRDAEDVCDGLKKSKGHYETMIDPQYKYVGFGCANGLWAQVFCVEEVYEVDGFDLKNPENNKPVNWDKMTTGERKNYSETFTTQINPEMYTLSFLVENDEVNSVDEAYVGEQLEVKVRLNSTPRGGKWSFGLDDWEYNISYGKQLKANAKGLICVEAGKTTITVSLDGYPAMSVSKELTVKAKKTSSNSSKETSTEKNAVINKNGCKYKILNGTKNVALIKASTDATSVTIPKTINANGVTYKVTKVANNAFKNSNVKKVSIGANVTSIGKNAFSDCKKLKTITIKSKKLASVGKNAFKNIHKKASIKVPKGKLSEYKKLLKNKGQAKTVKVKN